jgi:hypothetical protein
VWLFYRSCSLCIYITHILMKRQQQ